MLTKLTVALAAYATLSYAQNGRRPRRDDENDERVPYWERAEGPDDLGWFKSSTYLAKTRQMKMLDLWGKVMEDTSGPREPYWAEMPRIFTQRGNHAFDEDSDEI